MLYCFFFFFFSSRRRHTRFDCDWSSDVCSSDLSASSAAFWELDLRRLVEANKKRQHKPLGVKNETGTDDSPSRVCVSGGGTAVMSLLAVACLTQVLARCAPTGW